MPTAEQDSTLSRRAFTALRASTLSDEMEPGARLEISALASWLAESPMPVGVLAARRLGGHLERSANELALALGASPTFSEEDFLDLPIPRAS